MFRLIVRKFFLMCQRTVTSVGMYLLVFMGARYHKKEKDCQKVILAFLLLSFILLLLTWTLWGEVGIAWPFFLAIVFLSLLASGLFCLKSPECKQTQNKPFQNKNGAVDQVSNPAKHE